MTQHAQLSPIKTQIQYNVNAIGMLGHFPKPDIPRCHTCAVACVPHLSWDAQRRLPPRMVTGPIFLPESWPTRHTAPGYRPRTPHCNAIDNTRNINILWVECFARSKARQITQWILYRTDIWLFTFNVWCSPPWSVHVLVFLWDPTHIAPQSPWHRRVRVWSPSPQEELHELHDPHELQA